MFDSGISRAGGILDMGVQFEIVKKSGTWYSYGDERIGQGRENAKQYLKDNPQVAGAIELKIKAAAGLGPDNVIQEQGETREDKEPRAAEA